MIGATTTDAPDTPVPRAAFDQLRARVRGPLLAPADVGYDDARSIWNAMIDRHPAMILRCLGAGDVIAGIGFAREHGLPLCLKGGGHNIAGLAVCDGGLMLDMSLMRGVWVDAAAHSAHAQAGCLLGDVDRETQLHGLAAVLGFVSNTGIAGLTLGGGFGYLTRRFGWTCDNVRAFTVVTADGRLVRATERENADLFWGLRGGGGNFGIVTGIEYALYAVGPEIVGGPVAWQADRAAEVLELYRTLTVESPPELTCVALLRPAPPAPWLPPAVHGKPIVAIVACDTGPPDAARARAARIKSFDSPVGDVLQPRPYVAQQSLLDATQPKGRRYYWKSEFLPRLEPELLARVIDHAARIESPHSAIVLFHVQGALELLPSDYSAAGNRDAAFVLGIAAAWEDPAEDARHVEWTRTTWRDLRRFSTGGTYVNFLTADEGDDRIRAAYGANYDRLAALKATWDAGNVLRSNKNIAPAS